MGRKQSSKRIVAAFSIVRRIAQSVKAGGELHVKNASRNYLPTLELWIIDPEATLLRVRSMRLVCCGGAMNLEGYIAGPDGDTTGIRRVRDEPLTRFHSYLFQRDR
jgi:hypothetical protein